MLNNLAFTDLYIPQSDNYEAHQMFLTLLSRPLSASWKYFQYKRSLHPSFDQGFRAE